MSDVFNVVTTHAENMSVRIEIGDGGVRYLSLFFDPSTTGVKDVATYKTWAAEHPYMLQSSLATPITFDLGTIDPTALVGPDLTAQAVPTAPFALTYERDLDATLARLESAIATLA